MILQRKVIVAAAALGLTACADQTDWVKAKLNMKHGFAVDPAIVEQVRADTTAKGFPEAGSLVEQLLGEAVRQFGRHRFTTLIDADDRSLYVGVNSVQEIDGSVETDFVVRSGERGTLDIHMTLVEHDAVWMPKQGSYKVTLESPAAAKKPAKQ